MIIKNFDPRRKLIIAETEELAIQYAVDAWITSAQEALKAHQYFAVALSGGSTPKKIYQKLAETKKDALDWKKVLLFWSDERAVAADHKDSNYRMAMEAGFSKLPIPKEHIFPMKGDAEDLEQEAKRYEELILNRIPKKKFDLMMLGMGEDGHTASLFPKTHGLHAPGRWVIANFIPEKDVWRLTVTFECINQSSQMDIYVLGASKAPILKKVFHSPYNPDIYPVQKVGTEKHPAHYILDKAAANDLC